MKLLYTDIRNPLTPILVGEAQRLVAEGRRVFYIAPNSLSFEKERAVLEKLEGRASFAITVTRFVQMARYLILNDTSQRKGLDDVALSMLFFKILSELGEQALKVFGRIKRDPAFIQQLVELYHELQTAQMTFSDLELLDSPEKRADLMTIFMEVEKAMLEQELATTSPLNDLMRKIEAEQVETDLSKLALVIDGFTRFSAEESALISLFQRKGVEIVIGAYASKKAYQASFIEGNLYQASVLFLRDLAVNFQTKPVYVEANQGLAPFTKISRQFESCYDFSQSEENLDEAERSVLHLWNKGNSKEELEAVAQDIRKKVHNGARYKDFRLLLGDVESYRLQLGTIFEQYEIPFYLGRKESMAAHPLVHVVESLERLKRYNFRREDLLNLLKTGLYGQFAQADVDKFEQYLRYADINGQAKFSHDFTANDGNKFDLTHLNALRVAIVQPLLDFFKTRRQSAGALLEKFTNLLITSRLSENLSLLIKDEPAFMVERHEEVWKAFCHILEQVEEVFSESQLTVDDFLALVRSGILAADYRTVPATVDVVTVQSYDLIEPRSAAYVYAVGLTQGNFPKIVQNTSLLSDEERQFINEQSAETSKLQIASQENLQKNHFTAISLLNAAEKELVLSVPQFVQESEDTISPYIKELLALGFPFEKNTTDFDMGTYRGLLSRLVEQYQTDISDVWNEEEQTFWIVAGRVLRRKLEQEGLEIPVLTGKPKSQPLEQETLNRLYPADQALELSTSSLTEFYRNQYSFFLKYILRLQEENSIHPDVRAHGNFLHRVFERVMHGADSQSFDERLARAIAETEQEQPFQFLYEEDNESRFARELLTETAYATGQILKERGNIVPLREEFSFGNDQTFLTLEEGRKLSIRGKIDRVDQLLSDQSLGVVDYKSGAKNFDFKDFFNGLNSQLVTYLEALRQEKLTSTSDFFGAMYLHMTDPQIKLSETRSMGDIVAKAEKELEYKGLFLADKVAELTGPYEKNKVRILSREDLEVLLAYNDLLYKVAAQQILAGHFAINPYTEDGRSIAPFVEQHKAITGFEANHHFSQARKLSKLNQNVRGDKLRQAWIDKMKEKLSK